MQNNSRELGLGLGLFKASLALKMTTRPSHVIAMLLYLHPDMSYLLSKPLAQFEEHFPHLENMEIKIQSTV